MVDDAKAHEAEDKAAKDKIETKNRADSMVYQTEKQIKELEDKLSAEAKGDLEAAIAKLKKDLENDDTEAMKASMKALEEKLMRYGQEIYQQTQASGAGAQPGQEPPKGNQDGVVDAEIVDDEK
jgi:molecular chaperone DnaK